MKRFFNGFTLSEVLITLGVIGVVAAMTLPTLIQKQQKMIWTNQLKKSYSILNQGFQKMLADEGVGLLSQTSVFNSIGGTGTSRDCNMNDIATDIKCNEFFKNFGKYFKIAKFKKFESNDNYVIRMLPIRKGTYYNPYTYNAIIFADGIILSEAVFQNYTSASFNSSRSGFVSKFMIDINGLKGPNQMGRDVFLFLVDDNGLVHPFGSHAFSEIWTGDVDDYHWSGNGLYNCKNDDTGYGFGCAARVLEVGKMDY